MPRDYRLYLDDILEATNKISGYVRGMDYNQFAADPKTADAVVRNLEIIGEAVKHIPVRARKNSGISEDEWRKISGLRNILAHEYFGVNLRVIWDVVENKLKPLKNACDRMMN